MLRTTLLTVVVLALGIAPDSEPPDAPWYVGGQPVPDNEWRSSSGPFKVMLVFSTDPEKLHRSWEDKSTPKVTDVNEVRQGQEFEAIVIFSNCQSTDAGLCRVSADWTISASDGRQMGTANGVRVWFDRPAGGLNQLMIAEHGVGMRAELDFEGSYRFEATVRDEVSDRKVKLKKELRVVKSSTEPVAP